MVILSKNTKQRIAIATGVLTAICILAYYWGAFSNIFETPEVPQDTEVVMDRKIKIAADTEFIQKIIYLKCQDEEVFRTKPPENLIGMNLQQLKKAYSGWNIDKFDKKSVEMSLKTDSLCREHANNMFIGTKDGFVAVFYGKPGQRPILKEMTGIPVSSLRGTDLEELKQGITVASREEVLRILEGMVSR